MKDLRRNEFIDMLEMAEVLYQKHDKYIKFELPFLGNCTFYPKANKVQIDKNNKWEENGFEYVKQFLENNKLHTKRDLLASEVSLKLSERSISEKINQKSDSELRNEFAGLAMQGLISNAVLLELISGNNGLPNPEYVADLSFGIADAMVKRSKL